MSECICQNTSNCTAKICILLYVNYISIKCVLKRRKFLSILPPPRLPLPEETTLNRLYVLLDQLCPHRCSERNVVVVILLGRSVYVNGSILYRLPLALESGSWRFLSSCLVLSTAVEQVAAAQSSREGPRPGSQTAWVCQPGSTTCWSRDLAVPEFPHL